MRTKQVRPEKTEYEFELRISRKFNELNNKEYILFDFRTVKIFENFIYKINIEPKIDIEKKEIEFNIEGLSAPLISLSNSGVAGYQYKLNEFSNAEYTLKLIKQRKVKYLFAIKISKKDIKVTKTASRKFVNVLT
ncbi:MAG TPA: hypothetical protein VIK14_14225 [Ignavibacteria bacterium]